MAKVTSMVWLAVTLDDNIGIGDTHRAAVISDSSDVIAGIRGDGDRADPL